MFCPLLHFVVGAKECFAHFCIFVVGAKECFAQSLFSGYFSARSVAIELGKANCVRVGSEKAPEGLESPWLVSWSDMVRRSTFTNGYLRSSSSK